MQNSTFNKANTPFHSGELAVQKLSGEADIAIRNGSVINNQILGGAMPFIAQQNMLVLSSMDKDGHLWTSIIIGNPGFISAPNNSSLLLDTRDCIKLKNDPLWQNIQHTQSVGLIIIELATRRRYRVNGMIKQIGDNQFEIEVVEAYPNCPKYIQRRELSLPKETINETIKNTKQGSTLSKTQQHLITSADSFFVGSANRNLETEQVRCDASHRGGLPGFVEVINDTVLSIPDYLGNSMFNTLGNIHNLGRAGIIFIDFDSGTLLQLTGKAEVVWNEEDELNKTDGTKRFWLLNVESWIETKLPEQLSWNFYDYSPHNPRQLSKPQQINQNLKLELVKLEKKSKRINLYRFENNDGGDLPSFEAGSHLPVTINLENGETVERQYSLLPTLINKSQTKPRYYEIAVQREKQGRGGSKAFHKNMQLGSILESKHPKNEFLASKASKHTVLIAGGIGITPILTMLEELVTKKASFEIHYAASKESDLAFKDEVFALAGEHAHFYFSQGNNSRRIDLEALMKVQSNDTHFYLCGPNRMIEACRNFGERFGWKPNQIHFESFGAEIHQNDTEIELTLKQSDIVIKVLPSQTILEALIENKISVPFSCSKGECGICVTTVISGDVDHRDVFLTAEERGTQMCVCVSRAKGDTLSLDI